MTANLRNLVNPTPIRKSLFTGDAVKPRDVGELVRSLQAQTDATQQSYPIVLQVRFLLPIVLGCRSKPFDVRCTQAQAVANPSSAPLVAGSVSWYWNATQRSAYVTGILGLTPPAGAPLYNFTFVVVG